MQEPENFTHVALAADLFRALHSYLGQRPAAEAARLLVALEASPACNIGMPPALDAMAEVAAASAP